jgi:hypothetical protein
MRIDRSKGIQTTAIPCGAAKAVGRAWAKKCDSARRRGDCNLVLTGTGYRFSCVERIVGVPGSGGYAIEKLTGTDRHHRASLASTRRSSASEVHGRALDLLSVST